MAIKFETNSPNTTGVINKRFTSSSFDNFSNKTTITWKNPDTKKWDFYIYSITYGKSPNYVSYKFNLTARNVKTPEIDSLLFDYDFNGTDWLFFSNGKIIVNIDKVENIELLPHETNTDTKSYQSGSVYVEEQGYYRISKEDLEKICKANELAVRVNTGKNYFELKDKGLLKFQFMCRSFYSEVYNIHDYDQWINSIIPPGTEVSKGACFIATAAMGSYDHPVVMDLRMFRDNWLLQREWGEKFTKWYYTHGPKVANVIEKSFFLKKITYILIVKPLQLVTKRLK